MAYRRERLVAPLVVTMMLIAIAVHADQITASEGIQSENNNNNYTSVVDPWDLVKRLEKGDIKGGGLHIALLVFNGYLLPKMTRTQQQTLASSKPLRITVFDVDRQQSFQMKITKFAHYKYYLLSGGWTFEFVQPRDLTVDSFVGLRVRGSLLDFGKLPMRRHEAKENYGRGGHGSTSKLEEDPILAAALAKPRQNSCGGQGGTSPTISCRHIEIEGRFIAVMFNNGPTGSSEPDSEVPVDLSASLEQDTEGDTSGGHGPDGGPSERQSEAV
ncbi:B3 domain-containing protein [Actinidia chinensis var. chinensis]|uniref:B3 domain-containing protein n=1 Tax=Actinidia chinensis var. chinensis TaxID=1590841 RepID=A0A2R6QZF1_ACTCC|nr:B3 domain-containing protein [Actinidia chinensis var. chinensis]